MVGYERERVCVIGLDVIFERMSIYLSIYTSLLDNV